MLALQLRYYGWGQKQSGWAQTDASALSLALSKTKTAKVVPSQCKCQIAEQIFGGQNPQVKSL